MSGQTFKLKLYTGLRVDVEDMRPDAEPSMTLPDPDVYMDEAERKRFSEYHSAVQRAMEEAPVTKDLTGLFRDDFKNLDAFRGLADKVCALTFGVEDVEGKFFGTVMCELRGELIGMEDMILREYCRSLCDEMLSDGSARSPFARSHGDLSIRIWRDRSRFMLTEHEVERAPWRKPKQKGKGGDSR